MHSPSTDAPIPLLAIDTEQGRSGILRASSNNASNSSLLEEDTSAKVKRGGERVASPTYPPITPRTRANQAKRGGRTRSGSTRAVAGFGSRSRTSVRHALYLLMERPTSSNSAFVLHFVTNAIIVFRCAQSLHCMGLKLILCSAILTVLETLPFFHTVNTALWFGLETAVVVIFTVEYIARSAAWGFGERHGGWKRWWNWATCGFIKI